MLLRSPLPVSILFLWAFGNPCSAASVDNEECAHVIGVAVTETSPGIYRFDTTVSSTETGEDKYADEWRIVDADTMNILGTRVLAHPHVTEQPFTRSLSNVSIPSSVQSITIEARDSVLGYCGETIDLGWRVTGDVWTITFNNGSASASTGTATSTSTTITIRNDATGQSVVTSSSSTSSGTSTSSMTNTSTPTNSSTSTTSSTSVGGDENPTDEAKSNAVAATNAVVGFLTVMCLLFF